MGRDKALLAKLLQVAAENPHTGSAEQVVTLALCVAQSSERLSVPAYQVFRSEVGVGEKVFSKLKTIGEHLQELTDARRRVLLKGLPASYSTIHVLCSLKADELITGVKSKAITPKTSVRAARIYVNEVRYPIKKVQGVRPERISVREQSLFRVCRLEAAELEEIIYGQLKTELEEVCSRYGVELRSGLETEAVTVKDAERKAKALFWRSVLEEELNEKWFSSTDEAVRKSFNLKTVDEVRDTPLRLFTGFLIKNTGSRESFWWQHGQAYIAKVQYLMESTEDKAQSYNLRRRLAEVFATRTELGQWGNRMSKNSGLYK